MSFVQDLENSESSRDKQFGRRERSRSRSASPQQHHKSDSKKDNVIVKVNQQIHKIGLTTQINQCIQKKDKKDKKHKSEKKNKKDKSEKKHKKDKKEKKDKSHKKDDAFDMSYLKSHHRYDNIHDNDEEDFNKPKGDFSNFNNNRDERKKFSHMDKIEKRRQEKEEEYQKQRAEWEANRAKKPVELAIKAPRASENPMMEVICNDRLGGKVRVKCYETDTIKNLKLLVSMHLGTRADKIKLQKGYKVYKDHITLGDYEISEGMQLEMYYN